MHLTNAVSVVVPRPLPLGVADRGVAAAHRGEPVVPAPLIGVDRDHRPTRTPHDPLQRRAVGVLDDGQADLPALPSHHPADRWAVVLPAPVAGGLVGPPPRRVLRVAVRHTCYETGCQALSIKTRMTRGSACYSCSRHQIGSAIASEGRRLFCAGRGPQGVTTRYPQLADPRWLRPDSLRSTCRSGSTWTSSKH